MKKIIFGILLIFAVSTKLSAQVEQTATTNIKYWYYPSHNVYYNETTGDYWYYDEPAIKWMTVKALPPVYAVTDKDMRYIVVYKGPDVWKENKSHKVKYKIKKDGTIKNKS